LKLVFESLKDVDVQPANTAVAAAAEVNKKLAAEQSHEKFPLMLGPIGIVLFQRRRRNA